MSPTVQTALLISGIGMIGIFIFMALFYLLILALDKLLPHKEEAKADEK
ncbi:MAG: hypothetical protein GXZ19_01525 [Bacteroidales bacterium]|nr:hypothetical protein [Bacteroidales bacterium]